jgi:putative phage-type endonuclease
MTATVPIVVGELVLPSTASQEEWLAARRTGIGASEIAAVAGLSRRRGPWDVWSSKVDGSELEPSDEMRWGQFIESRIVDWWARETGRTVGQGGLFRHPTHRWLLATPDAVVLERPMDNRAELTVGAVVDAKNSAWHGGGDWDDEGAPLEYICQITQQMLAVGVREGYLVAVIGGRPPVERHLTLDDELAHALIERGEAFWRLVADQTPPPLDGSPSATRWLAHRYPDADPDYFADLDDADVATLRDLIALDARISGLKAAAETLRNAIRARLGAASAGVYKGQTYVTWKQIHRAGYPVKPTTYRKFTIPAAIEKELSGHGHSS